jgi:hypothetical protein
MCIRLLHYRRTYSLIVAKNPLTTKRVLAFILIVSIATAVTVPSTFYWSQLRADSHERWQIEANYAGQFGFQMDSAATLINGTTFSYNNITSSWAGDLMSSATVYLTYISYLDTSHASQLEKISYAIENVIAPLNTIPFTNTTYSQRAPFSLQLRSLAEKVVNAYWNFLNYTSSSPATGPPFWYSGPSPPDEMSLLDAVNISLSLQV